MRIEFLHFEIDTDRFLLVREGQEIRLRPKVFDLLIRLIECRERVVSREELCAYLWQRTSVGAGSLSGLVNELRNALGESRNGPGCLRTVHARGYQFVAEIRVLDVTAEVPPTISRDAGHTDSFEMPKGAIHSQSLERLERLVTGVSGAGKNRALGIWIEGAAGSGKSRLLDDLSARLAMHGLTPYRLDLFGEEFDSDRTEDALAELLRDRLAERGVGGRSEALLFDHATLGPRRGACAVEAQQHRARVRHALVQCFEATSAESRIIFGVDGVEGSGGRADLWLGAFFRALRSSSCALIATARPVGVDAALMHRSAFSNHRGVEKVRLRPLDAASLGAMFLAEGLPPLPEPLVESLIEYAASPIAPVSRVAHWLSGHHTQQMHLPSLPGRIMRSVRNGNVDSSLRHARDES